MANTSSEFPDHQNPAPDKSVTHSSEEITDSAIAGLIESTCGISLHPTEVTAEQLKLLSSSTPRVVNLNLTCRLCGYNLRGLMTDSKCPECGADISESLNENLLRYSAFHLVRKFYLGIKMVYASILWAIIAIVAFWVVLALISLLASYSQTTYPPSVEYIVGVVFLLPIFAFPVLYPLGWWWATIPDPIDNQKISKQRVILRWTAMAFAFVMPLWVYLPFSLETFTSGPYLVELSTHVFFILIWIHLFAMNSLMQDAISRCAPHTTQKKFTKHIHTLGRNEKWIRLMPVVLLAFHWIGMIFHYWVYPMKGLGFRGVPFGDGIGFFWISILWLTTIGMLSYLTDPVRIEYLIAKARHHEPDRAD